MYKYNEIKSLHLELSSNCQASCPMCARNFHGGLPNPLLQVADIDIELFKKICPDYFIKQLEQISMCGNFGDPILNNDLIDIIKHTVQVNPDIKIDIHTNGGVRTPAWWKELHRALPIKHLVHFALDGLEDTNHLYRVGTNYKKIIENAQAFIAGGGKARWNFITFKHNEHQIEQARTLAKEMGFESFYEKQTSRFIGDPWFDVLDKNGNVTHKLEGPTDQKLIFVDRKTVENYRKILSTATVECEVEKSKSIYIDALGYVWPCCFVGATPYLHSNPTQLVHDYRIDSQASLNTLVSKFGGLEKLNLRLRPIDEIVDSPEWQLQWNDSFENNSLHVCVRTCGKFPTPVISQSRDQFLDLKEFDE